METLVSVIMGSRSDWHTMKHVASTLASMSVSHEVRIVTANRNSDQVTRYIRSAEERGIRIIVASASGAAYLPGIIATKTHIPVLAVPLESTSGNGKDKADPIMQMPAGVPVATFAAGHDGAVNAALLTASMLANEHDIIHKALIDFREQGIASEVDSLCMPIAI